MDSGCKNSPKISSITKVSKHISLGFSTCTICLFRNIENKHDVCTGKDCMNSYESA